MRWCVAAAGKHEVRIVAHLFEQFTDSLPHLFRRSVLEHADWVDITHRQCCWGHILDDLLHPALVAEVVGSSTCRHHCLRALPCVATVMENHDEVVVLYLINNILHIR